MKHKLTRKLTLYFVSTLLVFIVIVVGVFSRGFNKAVTDHYEVMLEERAEAIAGSLSVYMQQQSSQTNSGHMMRMHNRQQEYKKYLEVVDDIAGNDVWIIDEEYKIVSSGASEDYNKSQLPEDVKKSVDRVLKGETVLLRGFSDLMNQPTVTVGTPVKDEGGSILAAVLIHGTVDGIQEQTNQAIRILIVGGGVALVLAALLSWILSRKFVSPLISMQDHSKRLIDGDYGTKLNVTSSDEIGELALTLNILSDRLDYVTKQRDAYDKMRDEFFADISHELRTPITVLRGTIEGIYDGVYTSDEVMDSMRSEIIQLQKLVDDLLELTRLNRVEFKLNREDMSLSSCLSDATRSVSIKSKTKNVTFEKDIEISNRFNGDYARIRQVFIIVLDNALKFTPENTTVKIVGKQKKDIYSVIITDSGSGFESGFNPFDRYNQTRKGNEAGGLGLGLSIADKIMKHHNSQIETFNSNGGSVALTFRMEMECEDEKN